MTQGQGGGTPAGWYPDPEGHGERWWNGVSWGDLRPEPPVHPQQPYPPQQYDQGQSQGQQSQPGPAQGYQHEPVIARGQTPQHEGQRSQPGQASGSPEMRCMHCGWGDFVAREFLLNTRGMTFFDMDAFNAAASCLICRRCGFVHWFATR